MNKFSVLALCLAMGTICSTCKKGDTASFKKDILGSWYQEGTGSSKTHLQFFENGSCIWYDSVSQVKHQSNWSIDNSCLYFDNAIGSTGLGISPRAIISIKHTKMLSKNVRWSVGKVVMSDLPNLIEE